MRIGQSIWHSKRIINENAETPEYAAPTRIETKANYLTCMPIASRGYMQIIPIGEVKERQWTIIANARYFSEKFRQGDLIWVDGAEPPKELQDGESYAEYANAVIKAVEPVNLTIQILAEENPFNNYCEN